RAAIRRARRPRPRARPDEDRDAATRGRRVERHRADERRARRRAADPVLPPLAKGTVSPAPAAPLLADAHERARPRADPGEPPPLAALLGEDRRPRAPLLPVDRGQG